MDLFGCGFMSFDLELYLNRGVRRLVREISLASPLFRKLRSWDALAESHVGGCTLFPQEGQIKAFLEEEK